MGQGFSSSNNIHLHLDLPFHYNGDVVTGKVLVNVVSSITINSLKVKGSGKEYTKFYRTETTHGADNTTTTRQVPVVDKKTIFKVKVPLLGKGELNPGNYEFPISFQLAHNLPGSFEFKGHHNGHEAISGIYYTIKAELDVQGIFSKDPKTKCSFQLLQRPSGVQAMPLHAQEDVQITGCCCISKGAVLVQADAGTNIVRAGDSLGVTVQVDNKSKVDIKSVQLLLEQCASIKDHVQMSRTVASHCFEGVVSFTSRTGGAALQAMLPVDHQLRATSLGQLARMWYQVRVLADVGGCCNNNAVIKVPVALEDHVPVAQGVPVAMPPGWSPMVYPQFKFGTQQEQAGMPLAYNECMPSAPARDGDYRIPAA